MGVFEDELKKGIDERAISLRSVKKKLASSYLDAFHDTEKRLAALYAEVGENMTLTQARMSGRLQSILTSLKKEYTKLTMKSVESTIQTAAEAYEASYLNFSEAAKAVGVTIGGVSKKAVLASVMNKNSTYNLIKTFDKNVTVELEKINSAIIRGISTGESYVKTAKSVEDAFNGGFNDALRVVRTEEGRNWTEAHLAASDEAKAMGLNVINVWFAAVDDRTRPGHLALDTIKEDEEGLFWAENNDGVMESARGPGLFESVENNVNCRCAISTELRD